MPEDQKNFLFAIALSLLVIVGWEFYFRPSPPPAPKEAAPTATAENPSVVRAPQSGTTAARAPAAKAGTPTAAWGSPGRKSSASIKIENKKLQGALQQKGSVLHDLLLTEYRTTLETGAPFVQLLSPNKFDAVFGWSSFVGEIINDQTEWKIKRGSAKTLSDKNKITFTYKHPTTGLLFHRKIALDENYMFSITDEVTNQSARAQQISPWGLVRRKNPPTVSGFYLLHEGLIGFFGEQGLEEIDYEDLAEEKNIRISNSQQGWLGFTDKYWAAVLIPNQATPFQAHFSHQAGKNSVWRVQYIAPPIELAPNQKTRITQHFFAGAKKTSLVDAYEQSLPIDRFDLMIDWGWFFFMTKPFFLLLDFFSQLFGSFGLAILMVTVLVKLAFFPLANKSYETMAVMRKVQPDLERIRARHKGDMMGQNREIAELWRKHEVKPLMGCLPMLLQMPVFFALYKVLFITIEMRHAPFFGWVNDLSAPDPTSLLNLFGLLPFGLPDFLIIGVWPILMGATMFVQMRLNPPPPDPIQRKVFAWAPVVIALLLARFPAGLVIYATWNTILSALQQAAIMKKQGVKINILNNLGVKDEQK